MSFLGRLLQNVVNKSSDEWQSVQLAAYQSKFSQNIVSQSYETKFNRFIKRKS